MSSQENVVDASDIGPAESSPSLRIRSDMEIAETTTNLESVPGLAISSRTIYQNTISRDITKEFVLAASGE
jgi:hypothetical protein